MSPLHSWIHEYLIDVAEQYGVNYFNIPPHEKPKTVQIIEFLHRGSEEQDSAIWARVSDSTRHIIVKFFPEAANEYTRVFGKRLTDYRTAIIRIKDFRPFIGRVPIGENRMTSNDTLALECKSAALRGNLGERIQGDPMNITSDRLIQMWIEGLNHGGGEGNVLKQRRIEQEKLSEKSSDKAVVSSLEQPNLDAVVRKLAVVRETRTNSIKMVATNEPKAKHKTWKPKIFSIFDISPEIWTTLKALPIEGEEVLPSPLKHKGEVNDHNGSPCKRGRSDNGYAAYNPSFGKVLLSSTAQEDMNDMGIDVEEFDERSSQPLSDWPNSEHENNIDDELLMQSSGPPPVPVGLPAESQQMSFPPKSPSSSLPPTSTDAMEIPISPSIPRLRIPHSQGRSRMVRRVSPPKQPQEWTQASGQERILAPASDTSMSQSQSQSQSRLQSQSQRHHETHSPGFPLTQVPKYTGLEDEMEETTRRSTNRRDREHSRVMPDSDNQKTREQVLGGCQEDERLRNTALAGKETPVQHDPVTWSRPSFMKEPSVKTKLGGLKAQLSGLQKSGGEQVGWLSWRELGRILSES